MAGPFSLWLIPPRDVRERYAALIDTLSRRLGTPRFGPHLTLCAPQDGDDGEVLARTTALAAQLAPLPIRLSDVGYTDQYFRCLYVRAERSLALLAAHRLACERLGQAPEPDFMPHLSLVYGTLARAQKEQILDEIGRRFDTEFVVDSIGLCVPAGPPAGWHLIEPFRLIGRP